MQSHAAELRDLVDGISRLSLSGSGSSEYAGDCVRPAVRAYEADVLREMDQKRLGMARIIAG